MVLSLFLSLLFILRNCLIVFHSGSPSHPSGHRAAEFYFPHLLACICSFLLFFKCRCHDFVVSVLRSGVVPSELELLEQRVSGNYVDFFLMCVNRFFTCIPLLFFSVMDLPSTFQKICLTLSPSLSVEFLFLRLHTYLPRSFGFLKIYFKDIFGSGKTAQGVEARAAKLGCLNSSPGLTRGRREPTPESHLLTPTGTPRCEQG